ncbi:MAG: shikimate dehydrogenase [Acidimicrobiales bacterium]
MLAPTGSTRLAAVIGSPVRHSLSPAIHNAAFAADGLDWSYVAFEVAPGQGARAIEAMRTLGIGGLSVTMPHKADVATAVDVPSDAVRALGACNCVYWSDGQLHGDNTDGDGLVEALAQEAQVTVVDRAVSVLGAGGAARSIVEALGRAGAASIHVWARNETSALAAAALSDVGSVGPIEQVSGSEIVINATSIGMAGGPNPNGIPLAAELISQHQIVHDIVYQPRETRLMAEARQRGATVVGGVGMLVHQAARQYTHWTGRPAPHETMRRAVLDGE